MFSLHRVPASVRKSLQQSHSSSISSKPPKEKLGPMQFLLAISGFAVALMAPAGWILHHIQDYKQRPQKP